MQTVIRRYRGEGAPGFIDELGRRRGEVEQLIQSVPGFSAYYLVRTADGGFSITVCQNRSGIEESTRRAAEWVRANMGDKAMAPEVIEGEGVFRFSA